ncbi:MAG TPA: beta-ketoacyl synthase chain length factor [Burkholderiales bacterium]|nr:beta-ketoacyl synthase chain length factor [Burkholderiales bacterium]
MMKVHLHGVGVAGSGLEGWAACREVLAARAPWSGQALRVPAPAILPAAERRRCNAASRLALAAAEDALAGCEWPLAELATVFTSADGDGAVTHALCESFAAPEPDVSPTQFHNSVHNAPAGYWGIATKSKRPSTSIAADQDSFAAGLFEAAVQATLDRGPVLLVAFDLPLPHPLALMRPRSHDFAAALLLSGEPRGRPLASLALRLEPGAAPSALPAGLGALADNPAARALPLLSALAHGGTAEIRLGAVGARQLAVRCER